MLRNAPADKELGKEGMLKKFSPTLLGGWKKKSVQLSDRQLRWLDKSL